MNLNQYALTFTVKSTETEESLNEFIESQTIITVSDFTVKSGVCVIFPWPDVLDFTQAISYSQQLQHAYNDWAEVLDTCALVSATVL